MHVLAATNNLYPDPQATGSGRYNYEVGRRLAERGHRVSVVTRQRGETPTRETVAGMDVYRYEASTPRLPRTFRAIRRHVDAAETAAPIDLLSLHGALSSFGVDRAVPSDRPRIYTLHGLWAVEYAQRASGGPLSKPWHWLNRRLRHRIEGTTIAHSDRVVVLSEYMRDRLERAHPDAPSSVVVPGGADTERFRPEAARDAAVFDTAGTNFLTVRRLTPRMGLETLLDAFASVVERAPDAHLYVGGDGPLRDDLQSRAARLGIAANVTFLGYVPEDDLAAAYAGADVFVLPTLELEGFGLVTTEALASGTPVIGTRAGATPEILGRLETRPGVPEPLLVEPGDADELAARMLAWHALSPSVRAAAGEACRDYVLDAGYTWEAVTDRIEALFERHVT
ncbi:glycosyltransferase family 4 protein [Haloplanus sp. C73]|uniref:glycosyltransferase family 4 protein n=1 Tax=Haloplanus sp. C73 TaxID=3421641 RepID=UPI003EC14C95